MKRTMWIIGLALTAAVAGCRETPGDGGRDADAAGPTRDAEPSAPTAWRELEGHWERRGGGEVVEDDGVLRLAWGEALTAARWTGELPRTPWEFEGEARRVNGTDFFFSLTFPVRREDERVTWIVGGWGGSVVGISSIDGRDASENETTTLRRFETDRWYALKLRVRNDRIEAWIDGERVIDFDPRGRELDLRPGPIEQCAPFGIGTWQSGGEMRGLRWRPLAPR